MLARICRGALAGLLACASLAVAGTAQATPENLKILTYNTAFLYLAAEHPSPVPPPLLCTACDPIALPPGIPGCECWPKISMEPNAGKYVDVSETDRALLMAQRIEATDQDVVVLNEVFSPHARKVLAQELAQNGYPYYVSRLKGVPVKDNLTVGDVLQFQYDVPKELLIIDFKAEAAGSGLMIFSKYPFMPLQGPSLGTDANCSGSKCALEGQNGALPLTHNDVSFRVYPDCVEPDCWASKGVGLVKVAAPGQPAYVAFTHMQADYEKQDWSGIREKQLETVRSTILGAIPPIERPNAHVYFAGDLNIPGANRAAPPTTDNYEWQHAFNPFVTNNAATDFFACGNGLQIGSTTQACRYGANGTAMLTDSWGFETSTTDLGYSNFEQDKRLDFLFHSSGGGRLCMQHSTIAWDLQADPDGQGGVTWLSDHFPVRGDFGMANSFCSPNDAPSVPLPSMKAHELQFGDTTCLDGTGNPCHQDEIISSPTARIQHGGNSQWFIIRQAGSYSIDITEGGQGKVAFEVYHHTDLSRPISPFDEDPTEWGTPYSMPAPPYYIRTLAVDSSGKQDRSAKMRDYTLLVHQHLCRSPMDGCFLDPGVALETPYAYTWPETLYNNPLTELSELWWKFRTSGAKNGKLSASAGAKLPKIQMQMEGTSYDCITKTTPKIEVYDDAGIPTQLLGKMDFIKTHVDTDHDWENDGLVDDLREAPGLPAKVDGKFETYFLKVTRASNYLDIANECNFQMTSYLGYHTNLTYLKPTKAETFAKLYPFGDDIIQFYVGYDEGGPHPFPPLPLSAVCSLSEPDECDLNHPQLRGYYVDAAHPTLWAMYETQLLKQWLLYGGASGIPTLDTWKNTGDDFLVYANGPNSNQADYYYYFDYHVCRTHEQNHCK